MNEKMKQLHHLLTEMYPQAVIGWQDDENDAIIVFSEVPIYDNGQRGTGEKLGEITVWFTPDGIVMYDPIENGEWV